MKKLLTLVLVYCFVLPVCAGAETIAQQIGAPETYQAIYYSNTGKTEVIVDAVLYMPETDHVNTYAVVGRNITAEDVARMAEACVPGTDWETDWVHMEMELLVAEGINFNPEYYGWFPMSDGSEDYAPYLHEHPWGQLAILNMARETAFGQQGGGRISYYWNGVPYQSGYSATAAYMKDMDCQPRDPDSSLDGQNLTYGEALEMAEQLVQSITSDFVCIMYGSAQIEPNSSSRAYAFRFTRVVDGINVSYAYPFNGTESDYSLIDPLYHMPLALEEITCVIDQGRIVAASWSTPWTVGDVMQENVELLPFEQIMEIFGTISPLTIQSLENQYLLLGGEGNRWEITEIHFGYMAVPCKDSSGLWELRPVWDFIGEHYHATEYWIEPHLCALTIDAIDGTVIDRAYGY